MKLERFCRQPLRRPDADSKAKTTGVRLPQSLSGVNPMRDCDLGPACATAGLFAINARAVSRTAYLSQAESGHHGGVQLGFIFPPCNIFANCVAKMTSFAILGAPIAQSSCLLLGAFGLIGRYEVRLRAEPDYRCLRPAQPESPSQTATNPSANLRTRYAASVPRESPAQLSQQRSAKPEPKSHAERFTGITSPSCCHHGALIAWREACRGRRRWQQRARCARHRVFRRG